VVRAGQPPSCPANGTAERCYLRPCYLNPIVVPHGDSSPRYSRWGEGRSARANPRPLRGAGTALPALVDLVSRPHLYLGGRRLHPGRPGADEHSRSATS
jgi:hypothetical protein